MAGALKSKEMEKKRSLAPGVRRQYTFNDQSSQYIPFLPCGIYITMN